MPNVSLAFFLTGAVCALVGMLWGVQMGMAQDFLQRDAHAHLNLVGWVTLSIMGGFYALCADARPKLLSWLNYAVSSVGTVLFVGFLSTIPVSGEPKGSMLTVALTGTALVIGGMALFVAAIVTVFFKSSRAS